MQPHDVIDAEQTGVAHLEPEKLNQVPIMVRAHALRIQRRKTPVLAFCKERIGRGPCTHVERETFALAPNIVSIRMHAKWQV